MAALNFPEATVNGQVFEADTGVIYTYIGTPPFGYWSGFTQDAGSNTLNALYVEKNDKGTKQTITGGGGLDLASTIQLNSLNGSAEFTGRVTAKEAVMADTAGSIVLQPRATTAPIGLKDASNKLHFHVAPNGTVRISDTDSVNDTKIQLGATGSAEFEGNIKLGNTSSTINDGGIELNQDLGQIDIIKASADSGYYLTGVQSDGAGGVVTRFNIGANGSAEFAGQLDVGLDGNSQVAFASGFGYANYNGNSVWFNYDGGGVNIGRQNQNSGDAGIKLKPDGSAEFASGETIITDSGNVKCGDFDANVGSYIGSAGIIGVRKDGGGSADVAYAVYNGGTGDSNLVAQINADGSAEFATTVTTANWPSDASTSIGGGAYLSRNDTGTNVVWKAFSGGTGDTFLTSQILANGSAEFAGNITAGDYPSPNSYISAANIFANANPKSATVANSGVAVYQDGANNGALILRNTAGESKVQLFGTSGNGVFTGSVASGFHGIDLDNVGNTSANEAFAITARPDTNSAYVRKTTIHSDGTATFDGSGKVYLKNSGYLNGNVLGGGTVLGFYNTNTAAPNAPLWASICLNGTPANAQIGHLLFCTKLSATDGTQRAVCGVSSGTFDIFDTVTPFVNNNRNVKIRLSVNGTGTFENYVTSNRAASGGLPAATSSLNGSAGAYPSVGQTYGIVTEQTSGTGCFLGANGNWKFTGTGTTRNITFELEPDNDANYVSTTDAEGNESRVYNGPTLDVKERLTKADTALQTLKTAAAAAVDFAELKAAIATALADI